MTANQRQIVGWMALILLPIAYLVGSQIYYARSISPAGIATVRDYFDRFGEPRQIRMVERDGQSCYEFTGQFPPIGVFAVPSAPPAYVFDEQGRFVGWCSDPGDTPSHRQTWTLQSPDDVEVDVIRQKFKL
jgi:hypothetical protein